MQRIEYFVDFKSPAAYLSLAPTLQLMQTHGVELIWQPYRTLQKAVPTVHPDETRSETHVRVRAAARQRIHLKYAALQGLPMSFPEQPGNTDLALAGLLFARDNPAGYAENAFQAYWVNHDDLNEPGVVHRLLEASGHDGQAFDATYWLTQMEAQQIPNEERGVVDAPAYVIEDEIFIGREHLPWIRALIRSTLPA